MLKREITVDSGRDLRGILQNSMPILDRALTQSARVCIENTHCGEKTNPKYEKEGTMGRITSSNSKTLSHTSAKEEFSDNCEGLELKLTEGFSVNGLNRLM